MSNKRCRGAFQSLEKWLYVWVHLFGGAPNIFPHSPSSIWSCYDCHSPVRAAQHLFSCLFNPMQELESDEKVGNDESCHVYLLQIPFHSSAKGTQAPNDTNSEMKAANLTVSGTELWCLTALPAEVSQLEEQISFLSRWGKGEPIWRIKGIICHFCWCKPVWRSYSIICEQTNSILHLSLILRDNRCL